MSKKPNSSIKVAAMSLNMTVEQVEQMLDVNMSLSVCQHEKRQIADMYKKLMEDYDLLKSKSERLIITGNAMSKRYFELYWIVNAESTSRHEPASITDWEKATES